MENQLKRKKPFSAKNLTMFLFTVPVLALYVAFFLVPLFMGAYYSFTNYNGLSDTHKFIGFDNYIRALTDSRFLDTILFNFQYAIYLIIGTLVISLTGALLLNKLSGKTSTFFRTVYFIPTLLSLVMVGLLWNELYLRAFPLIGQALGIEWLSTSLLGNPDLAIFGILIVNLWQGCAVPIVLITAGLQSVPADLYEAATVDGAGAVRKFFSITVPFIIPVITMILITTTKAALTIFDYIKVMTDGGPAGATESIGILIFRQGMVESRFALATAESMILFVIIALFSFITIKATRNKQVGGDS